MAKVARLLTALCLGLAAAAPAAAAPPMWVVKDADSTIVLFGSVHILPTGMDWTPPALKSALSEADDLWFEIPNDAATQAHVADLAARRALLPPDQSLSALLDKTSRARLERIGGRLGLPLTALDRMRPWMAEVQLMVAYLQSRGARTDDGVEQRIAALAPPNAERRAFETPEEQIAILSGGTMKTQVASLQETLREIEQEPDSFEKLLAAWMSGDPRRLAHEALDPMIKETPELYRTLVRDRNRAWVKTLEQRLKGSGRTVVVVGAGHLVGPESVPALLRARGVTVEGP